MSLQFFKHLNQYTEVKSQEFQKILSYFEPRCFHKKEIIAEAGRKCQHHYYVLTGCLQMFFINEKGSEQTVQFAIENWWMTDYLAFHKQCVSDFYIQAIEATQLLVISHTQQEQLLTQFPQLERYFRIIHQISYGAALMRIKYSYNFSKEGIYFHFTQHFPEFAQRVPQYLIASFLGLTPEYVSEIRKKKRS